MDSEHVEDLWEAGWYKGYREGLEVAKKVLRWVPSDHQHSESKTHAEDEIRKAEKRLNEQDQSKIT